MNRSIHPTPRAVPHHREVPAVEESQSCALTERRFSERRRYAADFRRREFRLRAATQAAGLGAYDLDVAAGDIFWSPELRDIAGLAEEASPISLERFSSLLHPDDREQALRLIEASLSPLGDGRLEDEYRLVRPDGKTRWVKVRGHTFFAGEGPSRHALGASGVVIDITEQRAIEQALREQSEELRLALRVGNSGTFQWDAHTHEHRWCNEMLALYGLGREEFGGRNEDWLACLLPEDRAMTWAAVERSLRTGEYGIEFRIRRRSDGEIRWLSARGQVSFDTGGRPVRMVGINVDITDEKRASAEHESSRARLEAILDSLSEGVVIFDLQGQVLNTNPAARAIMRYEAPEDALRRLPEFTETFEALSVDGRRLDLDEWPIGRVIRGESFTDYDIILRRKDDGSSRIISHNGMPVPGHDGMPALGVLTLRDVTERRQTDEALRRESSRLQAILDYAPLLIWIRDLEGRAVLANHAFFATRPVPPPEEFLGRSVLELFPPDMAERLLADDRWTQENDAPLRTEESIRHRDGSEHAYLTLSFPVHDVMTGTHRSICSISMDISERKDAEARIRVLNAELEQRVLERTAELRRTNEALLQSNMDLQHFAHATAHDFQTPLRSIASFTQLIQEALRASGNTQIDEWASLVVDNTRRLQMLIQELLAYARLEGSGRAFAIVDMNDLMAEVLSALSALLTETAAEVTYGELPILMLDRAQITQVIQNLIENGIKYNRSTPPRIVLSCEHQEDEWIFSVTDNGIGIDPRHHERIFEIFRRLHTYHHIPGSGIGLAVCRRILERHGGHIWVQSQPGEGSTFYFSLPAGA